VKLFRNRSWGSPSNPPLSIQQAIEDLCDSERYTALERAEQSALKAAEILGRLIEILHENDVPTDNAVLRVLDYAFADVE